MKNNQKRSKISINLHMANRNEHSSKSEKATKLRPYPHLLYHNLKEWMNMPNNNKAICKDVQIVAENSTKKLIVSI